MENHKLLAIINYKFNFNFAVRTKAEATKQIIIYIESLFCI